SCYRMHQDFQTIMRLYRTTCLSIKSSGKTSKTRKKYASLELRSLWPKVLTRCFPLWLSLAQASATPQEPLDRRFHRKVPGHLCVKSLVPQPHPCAPAHPLELRHWHTEVVADAQTVAQPPYPVVQAILRTARQAHVEAARQ